MHIKRRRERPRDGNRLRVCQTEPEESPEQPPSSSSSSIRPLQARTNMLRLLLHLCVLITLTGFTAGFLGGFGQSLCDSLKQQFGDDTGSTTCNNFEAILGGCAIFTQSSPIWTVFGCESLLCDALDSTYTFRSTLNCGGGFPGLDGGEPDDGDDKEDKEDKDASDGDDGYKTFTNNADLDITDCPITFYGQKYDKIHATLGTGVLQLCFKDAQGSTKDCINGLRVSETNLKYKTVTGGSASKYTSKLTTLKGKLSCEVEIIGGDAGQHKVQLASFTSQAAVYNFYASEISIPVSAKAGGKSLGSFSSQSEGSGVAVYGDVSGCRHSGAAYKLDSVVSTDTKTCETTKCDDTATITTEGCGNLEQCQPDGKCVYDAVCTVSGPAVIDINSEVDSVGDSCARTLLSSTKLGLFTIVGTFQERRRKDVSFLSTAILKADGGDVVLEHGGRARVNGERKTLSSSPQTMNGVALSTDQTKVTATYSKSDYSVSVTFDGNTAQIHLTGPGGKVRALSGLCQNAKSSLADVKDNTHSADKCETMPEEKDNSLPVECTKMTESCKALNAAPFTKCHALVKPDPYVTACTDAHCKYPAVDGLLCQFMEAYAGACALQGDKNTLDGWRSTASCSAPQPTCQDYVCSDNEFCGVKSSNGLTGCLCRANFAAPYRAKNTFGDATDCKPNSASVSLARCLLAEKDIDYKALHLNEDDCKGTMDDSTGMVTFNFDNKKTCGAVTAPKGDQVTYTNTIKAVSGKGSSEIVRFDQVLIDFSCFYKKPEDKMITFKIKHSNVSEDIVSGNWSYTLTIDAYTDAARTKPVGEKTEIQLNDKIYVEVKAVGLDAATVAVVTDSCWATNKASADSSPRYDMITRGCANSADKTLKVVDNGKGMSNYFSFNMFRFSGSTENVYLHCKVTLCIKEKNKTCVPNCNSRRRRSVRPKHVDAGPALITMSWTN